MPKSKLTRLFDEINDIVDTSIENKNVREQILVSLEAIRKLICLLATKDSPGFHR